MTHTDISFFTYSDRIYAKKPMKCNVYIIDRSLSFAESNAIASTTTVASAAATTTINLTLYAPCIIFQYVDTTNEMQHVL